MSVWGVVVAGGTGSRFGARKQFLSLHGMTVAARSVAACRSVCAHVVLVVPADSTETCTHGADVVVSGGASRAASVRAGLAGLGADADVVVVHDAARPLARPELFHAVLDALAPGIGGAICAVPVSDTIKRVVAAEGRTKVLQTLDRSDLMAVQTPQAFPVEALRRAHDGEPDATDDATLVEGLGLDVVVVPGDSANLKLTVAEDLARAISVVGG